MRSIIICLNLRSGLSVSQSHFNDVFLAQRAVLLRTLQRMVGNPSTAEDLLHETWLRVSRALTEHPVDHLEPFVFQTALNLALDHLRARRIHARTLVEDVSPGQLERVVAQLGKPEDAAHAKRLLESLSASLSTLSPRQQKNFHPQPPQRLQLSGNRRAVASFGQYGAKGIETDHGDLHRRGVKA